MTVWDIFSITRNDMLFRIIDESGKTWRGDQSGRCPFLHSTVKWLEIGEKITEPGTYRARGLDATRKPVIILRVE